MTLQLPAAGKIAVAEDECPAVPVRGRSGGPRFRSAARRPHGPAGLRVGRHRSTTAHLAAIYPCQTEEGLGPNGLYLGTDGLSGDAAFCYDPFVLYTERVINSANILVLGRQGFGKSTFVKTFLYRCIGALGAPGPDGTPSAGGRWAAICDPKGEYKDLADALGLLVVRLHPGGADRINPLDAGPSGAVRPGRARDAPHRHGHRAVDRGAAPQPDPGGGGGDRVGDRGGHQPAATWSRPWSTSPTCWPTRPPRWRSRRAARRRVWPMECRQAKLALGRLLSRDLRGMFDGPSTVHIDWSGRGIVLDLSAVHQDPDALATVMIPATSWLASFMADPNPAAPRKVQVIEESWAMLRQAKVAFYLQSCWKLCRDYGVANVAVAHRLSDLRSQADDGTATSKVAAGLLADTETRVIFRQSADQKEEARAMLGLSAKEADLVVQLAKGVALWKVGNRTAVVSHRVGRRELFVDTDSQMVV